MTVERSISHLQAAGINDGPSSCAKRMCGNWGRVRVSGGSGIEGSPDPSTARASRLDRESDGRGADSHYGTLALVRLHLQAFGAGADQRADQVDLLVRPGARSGCRAR